MPSSRIEALAVTSAAGCLAARLDQALPQTQCRRCGYPDCLSYAQAIALDGEKVDRCPPGGIEGAARLAALAGTAIPITLDSGCGNEGERTLAIIDEAWCIGCTLCLDACPTDAIVGINKQMHTVIEAHCTGCELCLPVCPVDCISLEVATPGRTGWAAWDDASARRARERYDARRARRGEPERGPFELDAQPARGNLPVDIGLAGAAAGPTAAQPGPASEANDAAAARRRAVVQAALLKARATRSSGS